MQIQEQDFVQYLTIKKKLATKTIDTYRIRFLVINRWLENNSVQLDKFSFENFLYKLKEKGLSNSAINTYIQTAKHIEGYCKDRSLPTGFTEGIENLPKTQKETVILSIEELKELLSTHLEYKNRNGEDCSDLDFKYLTLTAFIAITGCRFSEANSLCLKRLDISNGRATLVGTKNKRNRYVFFDGPIKNNLKKLIEGKHDEELVFTNSRGRKVIDGDFNSDLRKRAKKAGINKHVYAHLLRHTCGTYLVAGGVDISMVANILGHKDIQTTYETYVHLADDTLQKASNKHPLLRASINENEVVSEIEASIKNFHLEEDSRFKLSMLRNEKGLRIEVFFNK